MATFLEIVSLLDSTDFFQNEEKRIIATNARSASPEELHALAEELRKLTADLKNPKSSISTNLKKAITESVVQEEGEKRQRMREWLIEKESGDADEKSIPHLEDWA